MKPGTDNAFTRLKAADQEAMLRLKRQSSEAAIAIVKQHGDSDQRAAVLEHYRHVLERLNRMSAASRRHDDEFTEQKKELHWVAIQAERNEVQTLF
ncbi:hypothetical protein D3C73_1530850 [compost metagenome]